jgi:hypothetical protein
VNVTVVPAGPEVGLTLSAGITVNTASAIPEFGSVPVNVHPPIDVSGIVYVQLNPPLLFEVAVHAVPYVQLTTTADFFAKPVPLNVSNDPITPVVGLTVIDGE